MPVCPSVRTGAWKMISNSPSPHAAAPLVGLHACIYPFDPGRPGMQVCGAFIRFGRIAECLRRGPGRHSLLHEQHFHQDFSAAYLMRAGRPDDETNAAKSPAWHLLIKPASLLLTLDFLPSFLPPIEARLGKWEFLSWLLTRAPRHISSSSFPRNLEAAHLSITIIICICSCLPRRRR